MIYAFLIKAIAVAALDRQSEAEKFGFTFLGAGMWRSGYLGPNGNVFKVCNDGMATHNEYEFSLWQAWKAKELPEWIYIPHMELHANGILECEYMGNERYYGLSMAQQRELTRLGIYDFHGGNVRELSDGRIAVIDLGGSSPH